MLISLLCLNFFPTHINMKGNFRILIIKCLVKHNTGLLPLCWLD